MKLYPFRRSVAVGSLFVWMEDVSRASRHQASAQRTRHLKTL